MDIARLVFYDIMADDYAASSLFYCTAVGGPQTQ